MRWLSVPSIAIVLSQWVGCSVEKNYELLSKFFDGVPDPNAVGSFDSLAISQSPTFSQHQPYIQDQCSVCHPNPSEMLLTKKDSKVCLQCHEDRLDEYPYMHGPVAGVACLMCHNPHLSPLAHLLREEAPKLCLQCHEMNSKYSTQTHQSPDQDCLHCHDGHGGDVKYFLVDTTKKSQHKPESRQETQNEP